MPRLNDCRNRWISTGSWLKITVFTSMFKISKMMAHYFPSEISKQCKNKFGIYVAKKTLKPVPACTANVSFR